MVASECCLLSAPVLVGARLPTGWSAGELDPFPAGGVAHGDDTRGGSGSKVKMDAISSSGVYLARVESILSLAAMFIYNRPRMSRQAPNALEFV